MHRACLAKGTANRAVIVRLNDWQNGERGDKPHAVSGACRSRGLGQTIIAGSHLVAEVVKRAFYAPMNGASRRPAAASWLIYSAVVYSITSIAYFVVPVWRRFSEVLLGSTPAPHDTVLNAGILEWDFRALLDPQLSVFDWTAGFPLSNTLAGTENLLGWLIFYGPLRASGLSVAGSYNVVLLLSLLISAIGTAILARWLGASRIGAFLAGFAFAFYPLHIDHASHLQTMSVCWSPFALLGMEMTLSEKSLRGPALLGAGFIATALSGMYFGVFLTLVLAFYVIVSWLIGRYPFRWEIVGRIAVAGVVSLVLLSPVLLHYFQFASAHGAYKHPAEMLTKFSFPPVGLLRTPNWLWVWQHTPLATEAIDTGGFPGLMAGSLVLLALMTRRAERDERRIRIQLLVPAVVAFLLALGPVLTLHSSIAYEPLRWLPMPGRIWLLFTAIRWPTRMILYTGLFGSVLAGIGLDRLAMFAPERRRAISTVVFLLVLLELRPATWYSTESLALRDPMDISDAYPFLSGERDTGGVVELPGRQPDGYASPYAALYAYGSAGHMRRVTAFHGSFLPPIVDSMRTLSFNLPDSAARDFFASHGVTRLVVHKDFLPGDSGSALARAFVALRYPLLFDSKRSAVFALVR